jgi:drug/metabolite transporter (DMT)-like permease
MKAIDVALLVLLSAIWGSSFIFMSYLAPLIGPVATADMRMFLAGAALVAYFLATRFAAEWRRNWRLFLLIGLLNSAIPFLLYSTAALVLPASMEAIFNSMSPMFGALFAAIWLGERLTFRTIAGLLLGIAGVVAMSSLARLPAVPATALAICACLLAPACYGLAGVYIRRKAAGVKPMAIAGGSQLLGGLALMPFLLVSPPPLAVVSPRVAFIIIAFALLCSAVAYLIYYRLIADVGPTRALTVTFLIPVCTMLWQYLLLRQAVTASMIVGAALVLLGTFLVTGKTRRRATAVAALNE